MANLIAPLLSQAITKGEFQSATKLIEQYGQIVIRDLHAAANHNERTEVLNNAMAFLHDRLRLARVMRSHLQAQLKALSGASSYSDTQSSQNTWQVDG